MITAADFLASAGSQGFDFYTGVPCSYLTPLINGVISAPGLAYVGASSEGEAVAIAAGAWLAGKMPVAMMQNSGLGNAVNPLTSLNAPFRIPLLLIVTWRGEPGRKDEPQHDLMGQITPDLLSLMRIEHRLLPDRSEALAEAFAPAAEAALNTRPFAFIMQDGSMRQEKLNATPPGKRQPCRRQDGRTGGPPPRRSDILRCFLEIAGPDRAVIATTGKTGRELFMLEDRPQHLYLVGSMGGASGVGLGAALNTSRQVVVLDGDGAALMKLGTLCTIGAYAPKNLIHVLLDNGVHDSTGGQPTVSAAVDFPAIAAAAGYAEAASCDDVEGFAALFEDLSRRPGPSFLHVRIAPGSLDKLIRPTIAPSDIARRFRAFLTGVGA